jgi:hypothetical protein
MLQLQNQAIQEYPNTYGGTSDDAYGLTAGSLPVGNAYWPYPSTQMIWWNQYPVYVCTDKTKKAIEILKALQADKQLECKSVRKFIELIEKISGLL